MKYSHYLLIITFLFIHQPKMHAQVIESGLTEHSYEEEIIKTISFNYLLHLPKEFTKNNKYPLIIYLHGSAQRGENLELVKKIGLNTIIETIGKSPFIVVAPQCSAKKSWDLNVENLEYFLDMIIETYSVDPDRIYLTGFSNGALGVYYWAVKSPERFAALVPVSGYFPFYANYPYRLKDIPIWAFHGELDNDIHVSSQESLINDLKNIGASPKFTIFPKVGHNPQPAYSMPELYEWLAVQKRPNDLTYRWTPAPSLTGNTTFRLRGYPNAKVIALSGTFNNWNSWSTIFGREGDEWICRIDLEPGKYQYKFIVDGEWIIDSENKNIEGEGLFKNSVLIIEK